MSQTGKRISQIALVSAVLLEIARQHPGIRANQYELGVITKACNDIVAGFGILPPAPAKDGEDGV